MKHYFNLVVETAMQRAHAEAAVLAAFGSRQPDGCRFHLEEINGVEEARKDGFDDGAEALFQLVSQSVRREMLKDRLNQRKLTYKEAWAQCRRMEGHGT